MRLSFYAESMDAAIGHPKNQLGLAADILIGTSVRCGPFRAGKWPIFDQLPCLNLNSTRGSNHRSQRQKYYRQRTHLNSPWVFS